MAGGRLEGKGALVTGGGRGIGRAIAFAFAREGARVAVVARTRSQVEEVASEVQRLGARGVAVVCDVSDAQEVQRMATGTQEALSGVDVLVNSAGLLAHASVIGHDDDLWERTLRVNLTATYYCTKALLPGMVERGWGRIINLASVSGKMGGPHRSAYHAAKHGVIGFTRSAALEVARSGVTVNAICPGFVDTEMVRSSRPDFARLAGKGEEETMAMLREGIPLGRFLEAEEVAALACYLASEEAGGMTGQALNISGGSVTW
ncbi:MAG: SDR family NAD(P)-dependent oxidoreductase [Nitrospinota bacterium]